VDWLVKASVSEKHAVSIFRAEVMMLGIKWDYIGWQKGKCEEKGQSGRNEVEIEPGQWGDSKPVSEEGGQWRIRVMKSALSGPMGWGDCDL
jgi:hypothetical protein